jgi:hypothetical protein
MVERRRNLAAELQARKQSLADGLFGGPGGEGTPAFTAEDLEALLGPVG